MGRHEQEEAWEAASLLFERGRLRRWSKRNTGRCAVVKG